MPRYPYGRYEPLFLYNPADLDGGEEAFLGEKGRFNGGDIIETIAKQPATARFISRHLYNLFVADKPQVPAWQNTPPRDTKALKMLEDEYFRSNYDIRSMLRLLFNSNRVHKRRLKHWSSRSEATYRDQNSRENEKTPHHPEPVSS